MTPAQEDRARPVWLVAILVLLGVAMAAGFLALGLWQVERLAWKRELIATVDARVAAPPVPWAEATRLPPEQAEYRPVTITGHFDHRRETLVQAVTELGGGFWVLTPLVTPEGETVLINRGFVPQEKRDPATRMAGQVAGPLSITGLIRVTEPGGAFLRKNNPVENHWYSRDTAAIAKSRGLGATAPMFIDADRTAQPGGYPIGGLTVVKFRNSHLSYVLTWFALSLLVVGGLVVLVRHEIRLRRAG